MTSRLTEGKFNEVETMVANLPKEEESTQREGIIRAKIFLAWHKKDYEEVFKLIEEGKFSNAEDLIEIWDQAHYLATELKRRKPLTPLQKYRSRERYPLPPSICPKGGRKKRGLSKATTDALRAWFDAHAYHPYPGLADLLGLAKDHGLTMTQLKNWFANARRRRRNRKDWTPESGVSASSQSQSASPVPTQVQEPMSQSNSGTANRSPAPQILWNNGCFNNQFSASLQRCPQFVPTGGQLFAWLPEFMGNAHVPFTPPGFQLVLFSPPSTLGPS